MAQAKLFCLVILSVVLQLFLCRTAFAQAQETYEARGAGGQTMQINRAEIVRLYRQLTIPVGQNGRLILNVIAASEPEYGPDGKRLPLQGRTVRATYEITDYRHDVQVPTQAIFTLKKVDDGQEHKLTVRLGTGWQELGRVVNLLESATRNQKVYIAISENHFPRLRMRAFIEGAIQDYRFLTQVGDEPDSLENLSLRLRFTR